MPKEETSFIPRKNTESQFYKEAGPGFLLPLALAIFLLSFLTYGGLYLYKSSLNKEIASLNESLKRAADALDLETISNISDLSSRIEATKNILKKHIKTTSVFDFLQKNTVKNVYFKSFRMNINESGDIEISMTGSALSYLDLAEQAEVFSSDKYIKDLSFSSLSLGDKGSVNFNVSFKLDSLFLNANQN